MVEKVLVYILKPLAILIHGLFVSDPFTLVSVIEDQRGFVYVGFIY